MSHITFRSTKWGMPGAGLGTESLDSSPPGHAPTPFLLGFGFRLAHPVKWRIWGILGILGIFGIAASGPLRKRVEEVEGGRRGV